jgi:hypothetical protein
MVTLDVICLSFAILLSGNDFRVPENSHYHFAGPFSQFATEGAVPGSSTSGIAFSVDLSDGGNKIASTHFELKAPEWKEAVWVDFNGAKVEGGRLKGEIKLRNSSGFVLEGLRLDCVGADETYEVKGSNGDVTSRTRNVRVDLASPLLLGDVQAKDSTDTQSLSTSELHFLPETKQVSVHFRLSGLTWLRRFVTHEGCGAGALSLDSKGRIYMSDRDGLWRCETDGSGSKLVTKFGDYTSDVVVDPTTDTLFGGPGNGTRFTQRSLADEDLSKIPTDGDFDHTPFSPTIRSNGDLYLKLDADVVVYRGGKEIKRVNKIGDATLATDGYFDVGPNGSLAFVTQGTLYVTDPELTTSKRLTFGPDWHLGRLQAVAGVRRDAAGNFYVSEYAWDSNLPEPWRISVFDKNGHFVRVFGRGDRTPVEGQEEYKDGQLNDVHDMIFGKDGTVYISSGLRYSGTINVLKPF